MKKNKRFYLWIINILCLISLIIYTSCGDGGVEPPGGNGGDGLFIPNAPSSLTCTAVSSSQIDLSWQDNSGNEDGFKIERKKVGESFSLIYTTGANITSYSDTGIEANTTYYYRVHAYNTAGDSAYSNEAFDTTQVLVATAVSYDQIDLTWRDYFDNEDGFKIERRKVGESFSLIYTTGENVTAWSNIGIDVNTTYYQTFPTRFDVSFLMVVDILLSSQKLLSILNIQ